MAHVLFANSYYIMAERASTPFHDLAARKRGLWQRLPIFWRFQLAGWAIFVAVTFPLKFVLFHGASTALLVSAVRDGSSFLITLALRWIFRAYWTDDTRPMAALIVLSCALAGLLQGGFLLLLNPVVTSAAELSITKAKEFDVLYERTGLLYAWSFLYFGIRHAIQSIQRDLQLSLIESEKRQAQLLMLRTQMNPHFLFNALNTIRNGVEKANAQLGSTVESLADFLRFSLDHVRDDFIPLGREFDAVQNYLKVEKARFRDKLEYECHIDEDARDVPAPGIVLQPLVENAIKYGQETSGFPLRLRVLVSRQAAALKIVVANTGNWLEPEAREKTSHIGLENLRHRLALLYPGQQRLDITPTSGWVTITIHLPIL